MFRRVLKGVAMLAVGVPMLARAQRPVDAVRVNREIESFLHATILLAIVTLCQADVRSNPP